MVLASLCPTTFQSNIENTSNTKTPSADWVLECAHLVFSWLEAHDYGFVTIQGGEF